MYGERLLCCTESLTRDKRFRAMFSKEFYQKNAITGTYSCSGCYTELIVERPEGIKWDVVALGKWDLSHWQQDSITENGKKCKKWELRVKQFQWN